MALSLMAYSSTARVGAAGEGTRGVEMAVIHCGGGNGQDLIHVGAERKAACADSVDGVALARDREIAGGDGEGNIMLGRGEPLEEDEARADLGVRRLGDDHARALLHGVILAVFKLRAGQDGACDVVAVHIVGDDLRGEERRARG